MPRHSILVCCFALALTACGSVRQPATEASPYVLQIEQPTGTELRVDVGATMLKITKVGQMRPTVSTELKYLGLAENGQIKLRVRRRLGDAVGFEQNQAEAFTLEGLRVEFIEVQAQWIRYRVNFAEGEPAAEAGAHSR